jgi:hypothetical protein
MAASETNLSLRGEAFLNLISGVLAGRANVRFTVYGSSMWPFIRDGDIVTVAPCAGLPSLGEVIVMKTLHGDGLVVHRLIGRRGGLLISRGDNATGADSPVPASHFLGRVSRVERGGSPVMAGLGQERLLIALLSRHDIIQGVRWARRVISRTFGGQGNAWR